MSDKTSLGSKTLAMPTPVWLVGAYDENDRPNGMIAAWGGICCSKPASVNVSLRPATYTHGCITARGAFTVSVPSREQIEKADYFGIVSGRDTDKFADTGLTPVRGEFVDAPYVGEFPLVVECKVSQTVEIGMHTMFVGEIMDVKVDPALMEGKVPDMAKVSPPVFDPGARRYHALGDDLGQSFSIGMRYKP